MKADEVHKMSDQELNVELGRLRRQLYDLRSQAVTETLKDSMSIRNSRRDIARVLTEQRRRQETPQST